MKIWIVYAFLSMFCAGLTSVIAKKGLENLSADLGMAIRTLFVFGFTLIFALIAVGRSELTEIKQQNCVWLGVSAFTTFLSWVFYYRAIKLGEVSTVALIDKGSIVIAVIFATLFLHESVTLTKIAGAMCIVAGLFIIALG
ncbi:MAG TPA: EamA family transporter [Drouetiella sp.]